MFQNPFFISDTNDFSLIGWESCRIMVLINFKVFKAISYYSSDSRLPSIDSGQIAGMTIK